MKLKIVLMLSLSMLVASFSSLHADTPRSGRSSMRSSGRSFSSARSSMGSFLRSNRGGSFGSYARYQPVVRSYGIRVAAIPDYRSMFYFHDRMYYWADGIIYIETDSGEYDVVEPTIGMIVPELPEVNVRQVQVGDKIYFEFDSTLYKQIPTQEGLKYEVVGSLEITA